MTGMGELTGLSDVDWISAFVKRPLDWVEPLDSGGV